MKRYDVLVSENGEFIRYEDYRRDVDYLNGIVASRNAVMDELLADKAEMARELHSMNLEIQRLQNKITEMQWTAAYDREMNMKDDREMGR